MLVATVDLEQGLVRTERRVSACKVVWFGEGSRAVGFLWEHGSGLFNEEQAEVMREDGRDV